MEVSEERQRERPLGQSETILCLSISTVAAEEYLKGPISEPSYNLNLMSTKSSSGILNWLLLLLLLLLYAFSILTLTLIPSSIPKIPIEIDLIWFDLIPLLFDTKWNLQRSVIRWSIIAMREKLNTTSVWFWSEWNYFRVTFFDTSLQSLFPSAASLGERWTQQQGKH